MKYNSTGLPLRLREQVSGEIIDGGLSAIDICEIIQDKMYVIDGQLEGNL